MPNDKDVSKLTEAKDTDAKPDKKDTIEVKDAVVEPKTPEVTPRGSIIDIFSKLGAIDLKNAGVGDAIILAAGSKKTIESLLDTVNNIKTDNIEGTLTDGELISVGVNYNSNANTIPDDVTRDKINSEEHVNSIQYADKTVGITEVAIKAKGKLSGSNAVAKFTSKLGIGNYTSVTLWHSGFSIVLEPPKESEIVNLHYSIAKMEYRLGLDTNNFIYSNYGVVINKLLSEFIISHIVSSSLDLPDDSSYIDYIKLTDLNTMAIGMATAMRPQGYPITVTCNNSLVMVDDHPVCDYVASADIIPSNLLWVNRSLLTGELLEHISKTSPGSHSTESIVDYQEALAVNSSKELKIQSETGELVFEIQTPNLRKYIDSGEYWIQTVIEGAEELFVTDDSEEVKTAKIDSLVMASILNKYNGFINKITIDDTYADDLNTISDLLEMMSGKTNLSNELLAGIVKYIDDGYISLVATYVFDCPKCKTAGRDAAQGSSGIKGFKEFIPFNAVDHFFDLSTLKFTQIMDRDK